MVLFGADPAAGDDDGQWYGKLRLSSWRDICKGEQAREGDVSFGEGMNVSGGDSR